MNMANRTTSISISQNFVIVLLLIIVPAIIASQNVLSITRVAIDKNNFEPNRGEIVTLRYRISQPATVFISFTGPDGQVVRNIKQVKTRSGEQLFRWDGTDK